MIKGSRLEEVGTWFSCETFQTTTAGEVVLRVLLEKTISQNLKPFEKKNYLNQTPKNFKLFPMIGVKGSNPILRIAQDSPGFLGNLHFRVPC